MATLKAHGRTELARVQRDQTVEPSEATSCVWQRTTFALMSDGTILRKLDVRFKRDASNPEPAHTQSYGWKVHEQAKPGRTVDRFVEVYTKAGYTRV